MKKKVLLKFEKMNEFNIFLSFKYIKKKTLTITKFYKQNEV